MEFLEEINLKTKELENKNGLKGRNGEEHATLERNLQGWVKEDSPLKKAS